MTAPDLAAIRAGTDPLSRKHQFLHLPFHRPVDLPPEDATVAEADWQDWATDTGYDEPEDRTLTGDLPPGFDARWWDREGQL